MPNAGLLGALSCAFALAWMGCQPGDDDDAATHFRSDTQPAPVGADGASRDGLVLGADPNAPVNDAVRALCAKLRACDLVDPAFSEADCLLAYSQPCMRYGSIRTEDGLRACVDALTKTSCTGMVAQDFSPCIDAIARARSRVSGGSAARTGEACGDGVECLGLALCDRLLATPQSACGQCKALGKLGDACEGPYCIEGYCELESMRCVPKLALGEACEDNGKCESTWCGNGVCSERPGEVGSACASNEECDYRRCVNGHCAQAVPLGGVCEAPRECLSLATCIDRRCVFVADCGKAEVGEACGLGGCEGGLRCDFREHQCVGEPKKTAADPCAAPDECESNRCVEGTCRKSLPGAICEADNDCESGMCEDFWCIGNAACEATR